MENISSRGPARFVGYFHLIATIVGGLFLIGFITKKLLQSDLDFEKDSFLIIFLVIIVVAAGLLIPVFIFFSILLLKATKLPADPKTSLKRVKIWLRMNIFLFVLGIFSGIHQLSRGDWISLVVLVCVQGPLIWLVQRYMKDLACYCINQPSSPLPASSV